MHKTYNSKIIEEKWQKKWNDSKLFESEIDERKKYFITIPYPYLNGNLHAGHTRTFTIGDVIARYKRACGYNVLFPMGFHVTGTPIIGLVELIANKDPSTMEVYSKFHKIPMEILEELTTPEKIVDYFKVESENAMRSIGFSIDWRRKFTTTDPHYKKLIEWQFNLLHEKGFVVKGSHPVKWCPNDENPLEDHDILHGENATIMDYIFIKFKYDNAENIIFPCATLRPETIFGVTNLWINPDIEYVKIKVIRESEDESYEFEAETWIVSKESYYKLTFTDRKVEFIETIDSKTLIGIKVKNPLTDTEILTLPARFVKGDNGSGIVMSVPAHAPFDFVALDDLKSENLSNFGIEVNTISKIEPISLIKIPDFGEYPAIEIVKEMKIKSQQDEKLELATKTIYKKEFHKGVLKENTGKYAGIKVSKIKDILTSDLLQNPEICELFYELSEPVVCRCGTKGVINMVKGQWFLNYSNPKWKKKAYECVESMEFYPPEIRTEFNNKIDWLKDKACTRRKGLGTKLPFDNEWLIESLGDSTIYMTYYIIRKFLDIIKPEQLNSQFFDFVLLNKGDIDEVSNTSNISKELIQKILWEFNYWYPVDIRSSGKDLIANHLLFFIFHHTVFFDKDKWPKSIAINSFVSLEGEKMSKSKGPLLTLTEAVDTYGADITRMYILLNAEQSQDVDWKHSDAGSVKKQVNRFYTISQNIIEMPDSNVSELKLIDKWMLSRLQYHIKETNISLKAIQTRNAIQHSFFLLFNDIRWYQRRGGIILLKSILNTWVRLLSPVMPHICEELWVDMGQDGFISQVPYPEFDLNLVNKESEFAEELVKNTLSDIESIVRVIKQSHKKVYIYTSSQWKNKVFNIGLSMQKEENLNVGLLIKTVMKDSELRARGKEVQKFIQKIIPEIKTLNPELLDSMINFKIDEEFILKESISFLEQELSIPVEISSEDSPSYDPENKSRFAIPMRVAIYLELD